MAQVRHNQTNWTAGEISPLLFGRVDIDRYPNGASEASNFVVMPYGGVTSRPGSYFVTAAKFNNVKSKLKSFTAGVYSSYVIEFGEGYARFHYNRGRLEIGGVPVEVALPYAAADLPYLRLAQSGDNLFITHKNYPPRLIRRTSDTTFETAAVQFENGPWENVNTTQITMTPGTTDALGNVTVTASADVFVPGDVGRMLALFDETVERGGGHKSGDYTPTAYTEGQTFWSDNRGIHRLWRVVKAGTTAAYNTSGTTPEYDEDSPEDEGDYVKDGTARLQYLGRGKSIRGWGTITGYTSSTVVTVNVTTPFAPGVTQSQPQLRRGWGRPRSSTTFTSATSTGTVHWKLGAWGGTNGYPRAVCFYQQRSWWAGSITAPQNLWSSQSGDFYNMAPTEPNNQVLDTNSIVVAMDDDESNSILWLLPVWRGVAIGTASGEHILSAASSANQAVSPTNIYIRRASDRGSTNLVPATRASNSAMFVQRGERKLREMAYDFGQDAYATPPASMISEHITDTGVADIAMQELPDGTLWLVREDGDAATLTYDKEQQVRGWSHIDVGGQIESVAVSTAPDGKSDDVYIAVRRIIDGNEVRYIEVIRAPFRSMIDGENGGFFVDCGLTYDGAPATTFSGLGHLEGETVQICADGARRDDAVVSGGSVSIEAPAASLVHIGLGFTAQITALPIEAGAQGGTAQGVMKKTTEAFVRLFETRGGEIGFLAENSLDGTEHFERIQQRAPGDDVNAALPLYSALHPIQTMPLQWDRECKVTIRQTEPLPLTVLSLIRVLTANG